MMKPAHTNRHKHEATPTCLQTEVHALLDYTTFSLCIFMCGQESECVYECVCVSVKSLSHGGPAAAWRGAPPPPTLGQWADAGPGGEGAASVSSQEVSATLGE